jgi:predicted neuraminidase
MNNRLILILSLVTVMIYAWSAGQGLKTDGHTDPKFGIMPPSPGTDTSPPYMAEEYISPDLRKGMVHAASICRLSDGGLASVWYGGSREGASDTVIYLSVRNPGVSPSWSSPRVIVNRETASKELQRFVKKVGNAIIFADREDRLWLIYVTITVGGWSGSSLNVKISADNGANWTPSQRLTLSPFLNISELVRNNPVPLEKGREGGGFVIPIYHEFLGKFPELLWISAGSNSQKVLFRKSRMDGGRTFIQPSVVAYGPGAARAFYRNCSNERTVGTAVTEDGGATWSRPREVGLPNPDSALNALRLSDGNILLVFNDSKHYRENLRFAISKDNGITWTRVATLEDVKGEEVSYPYMIRGQDGRIQLVYTWLRKRIKHVEFNEAWVREQIKKVSQ